MASLPSTLVLHRAGHLQIARGVLVAGGVMPDFGFCSDESCSSSSPPGGPNRDLSPG